MVLNFGSALNDDGSFDDKDAEAASATGLPRSRVFGVGLLFLAAIGAVFLLIGQHRAGRFLMITGFLMYATVDGILFWRWAWRTAAKPLRQQFDDIDMFMDFMVRGYIPIVAPFVVILPFLTTVSFDMATVAVLNAPPVLVYIAALFRR